MFVRPRRYATVRTRLDVEAVREQLAVLAASQRPEGWQGFKAHGWFLDGRVTGDGLAVDYHFNASKNPQTYAVAVTVTATPDWRYVELRIDAHAPWLDGWTMLGAVVFAGLMLLGPGGVGAAVATIAFVLAVYAAANLVYVPSVVRDRVAAAVATAVHGSVRHDTRWTVPR